MQPEPTAASADQVHCVKVAVVHLDAYDEAVRLSQLRQLRTQGHLSGALLVGDLNAFNQVDYSDKQWKALRQVPGHGALAGKAVHMLTDKLGFLDARQTRAAECTCGEAVAAWNQELAEAEAQASCACRANDTVLPTADEDDQLKSAFQRHPTSKYGTRVDYALLAPRAAFQFAQPASVRIDTPGPSSSGSPAGADAVSLKSGRLASPLPYAVLHLRRTLTDHNAIVTDLVLKPKALRHVSTLA